MIVYFFQFLTRVLEGSIRSLLLFLLYINKLYLLNEILTLLFANNTALSYSSVSLDELLNTVNLEFNKLCTYFGLNKLSLHPDKTKDHLITYNNIGTY